MLRSKLQRVGLLPATVDRPSSAELDQLIALVADAHPTLKPTANEASTYKQHFSNALHFLTFAFRSDTFSSYAVTVHLDECAVWLQKFDIAGGTSLRAFVAAAIASRFKYSSPRDFPFGLELGIGLGASARPAAAWRITLRDRKLLPPSESKKHVSAQVVQLNLTPSIRGVP